MSYEELYGLETLAYAILTPVGIGRDGWTHDGDSEWGVTTFQARKPSSDAEIERSGWTPTGGGE